MQRHSPTLSIVMALAVLLAGLIPRLHAAARDGEPKYTGHKISLDLHQAEIGNVLRLIAEASGLNIIASPEVQGTVTARLVDVPWDQALDVTLKLHGLTQERYGNVILITPVSRLIAQRQERLYARQVESQTEPALTHMIPVKYRDATDLKAILERHLGACAVVSVDARTNTLLITGTPSCLRFYQQRAP
jgi:type IV pilus assembly protein PilQ